MSWEQRKNDLIGGEKKGKDIAGQQMWNEGFSKQSPDNAARGKAAEGSFVETATAEQQAKKIEVMQAQIAENHKMTEALDASIAEVNAQLQKGEEAASKNPSVAAINQMLAAEALKKKEGLLVQKNTLAEQSKDLEGQIISMAH